MSDLNWLHLSDFHFSEDDADYDVKRVLSSLLENLKDVRIENELSFDFVVVTGDIAKTGIKYEKAETFFYDLIRTLEIDKNQLLLIPGNHDVDLNSISPGSLDICDSMKSEDDISKRFSNEGDRKLILSKLDNYRTFIHDFFGDDLELNDTFYTYKKVIKKGDKHIHIILINTAWSFCDYEEDILIGEMQLKELLIDNEDYDYTIALMHHPIDWIKHFDRIKIRKILKNDCDILLNGHIHKDQIIQQFSNDHSLITIQSGACYLGEDKPNNYNYVQLNLGSGSGKVCFKRYNSEKQIWINDFEISEYNGCINFEVNPRISLTKYKQILKKYKFLYHLKEEIKELGMTHWEFYQERLTEFNKLFDQYYTHIPIKYFISNFSNFIHKLSLMDFAYLEHHIENIKKDVTKSKKEYNEITRIFTEYLIDKYIQINYFNKDLDYGD